MDIKEKFEDAMCENIEERKAKYLKLMNKGYIYDDTISIDIISKETGMEKQDLKLLNRLIVALLSQRNKLTVRVSILWICCNKNKIKKGFGVCNRYL